MSGKRLASVVPVPHEGLGVLLACCMAVALAGFPFPMRG